MFRGPVALLIQGHPGGMLPAMLGTPARPADAWFPARSGMGQTSESRPADTPERAPTGALAEGGYDRAPLPIREGGSAWQIPITWLPRGHDTG
jgi:hypothetical protein